MNNSMKEQFPKEDHVIALGKRNLQLVNEVHQLISGKALS